MLHRVDTLLTYDLRSSEGKLGEVEDIYFDDRYWTVRYLVVETGGWLVQKRVLIAPQAIAFVDAQSKSVATELTKEQVENSPTPDEHAPVSRQFEMAYHDYYNYSPYWVGPMGESAYIPPLPPQDAAGLEEREEWDPHLYAVKDVSGSMGYTVKASDGDIGHVGDFVVSDDDWVIRYLVVDTRTWLPGKHVLLPPHWTTVDWENMSVTVDLTREAVKGAPGFDPDNPVTREYEEQLFAHYCRQTYWSDDSRCYDAAERRPPESD